MVASRAQYVLVFEQPRVDQLGRGVSGPSGGIAPNQIARESLPRCPPLSQSAARGGSPRARRPPCAGRADPDRRSPRTGSPSAYAAPASWRSVSPAAAPLAPRWPRTRATPRGAGVEPGDLTTSAVVTASPADAGALESGATSASRWVLAAVRIGLTSFRQPCRATIFVASFAAPGDFSSILPLSPSPPHIGQHRISSSHFHREKGGAMHAVVINATITDRDAPRLRSTNSCRKSLARQGSSLATGSLWDKTKASRSWCSTPRPQPRSRRLPPKWPAATLRRSTASKSAKSPRMHRTAIARPSRSAVLTHGA